MACCILWFLNNLINWLFNHCPNPDPSLPLFPTHLTASSLYHYKASFKVQVWSRWATAQIPSEDLLCSQIMSEPFGIADVVLQDRLLYMPRSPKLLGIPLTHRVPTWHMLLILPGKSCILYLPCQLLHEFRIQIRLSPLLPTLPHLGSSQWWHICSVRPLSAHSSVFDIKLWAHWGQEPCLIHFTPSTWQGSWDKQTFKDKLNSFIQQLFVEHLFHVLCFRSWWYNGAQNRSNSCFQWVCILFCWMAGQRYVWMYEWMN